MNDDNIRRNSLQAWFLAARPKTLSGAAVPVMIGLSLAYSDLSDAGEFRRLPALLCLLFAFVMQIDANFINDYFDFVRGNDDETRLGPKRACSQGWISGSAMKVAIGVTTAVACLAGLPLVFFGGWEMILVGAFCVVFCFLYTTHLSYLGMGDVLVVVFFGLVPVCVPYYIETRTVTFYAVAASLACGLVIDTLLVVNNYRDIDNDRRAGKITLCVRMGADLSRRFYLFIGFAALLIGGFYAVGGYLFAAVIPLPYMLLHYFTYRKMVKIGSGEALNSVLGETARNMFVYGLLVSLGLLLS
ncbi:MAG: 1,4-dihydroxy-2-naphthoate octaprenyltransferase [Prevotella sp.]|uniref:1,4-dihydroxy-2-naphthoate octaprenyltransferase n=1 Tax=Prevotella sp. TaxID=59823 RepID=UPI002A2B9843|nr:1,4-dihydroxy-2-naphthoate octaprenyltransferase [Prevotella sp.]MDD7318720.1 1,4-dihydroxy-2-naphthoate octaprenyltransferase [Prevotellaceae bacterium]MDY4019323.1 1,4-dihydroxy-2-naphthoate octaprenyltransferase [Prevotella sp.]